MYSTIFLLIFYTYKYGDIMCVVSNISSFYYLFDRRDVKFRVMNEDT